MAETITVAGREVIGPDGWPLPGSGPREVEGVVVSPRGQSRLDTVDLTADITELECLAPAGTVVSEGDEVTVRGLTFWVKHAPFDWSHGRRPAHPRHRPRVAFIIARGEG
ncbi:MAG: hypothetical protein Q4F65_05875 [Propionibacteriaceae bacterium]|nr:hypothetical protein [Propionibacteriaceae bacterium]